MKKKSKIIILDEVNCIVDGLDTLTLAHFWDKYGIFKQGAQFSPKFKLKQWDGKLRFFHKTGKTYVQLLPEIFNDLKGMGYNIELDDKRKYYEIDIPQVKNDDFKQYNGPDGNPLILADHQVDIINSATKNSVGILLAATNAGKTICCAILCHLYKKYCNFRCLIIVPRADLVTQTVPVIASIDNDVGVYSGSEKDINHDHVVSTWQALQNNKSIASHFNCVIIDEAHGIKSNIIREIINEHAPKAPVKLGLTGTLPKDPAERMAIRISVGDVIYTKSARDLIKIKWSSELILKIIILKENLLEEWAQFQKEFPKEASKLTYDKFKEAFLPDYESEKKYLKSNRDRNEFIANFVQHEKALRGNSLVLVNGIEYGKKIAKLIPNAKFIQGKDESEIRQEIYQSFKDSDDVVLVTSFQIASTGLDIVRIFNLFYVDAGNRFERVIQTIGRGLRKNENQGKTEIHVFDICSDLKYSKSHAKDRRKFYKEENHNYKEISLDYKNL